MAGTATSTRPSGGAGRTGALIGATVGAVLLWLLHGWPGWEVLPFLTGDTPRVLGAVDAYLVTGIVVGLARLVVERGRFTVGGILLNTAVGLVAMVVVLRVFPFALAPGSTGEVAVRVLLVVGIVGAGIGLIAASAAFVRLRAVRRG